MKSLYDIYERPHLLIGETEMMTPSEELMNNMCALLEEGKPGWDSKVISLLLAYCVKQQTEVHADSSTHALIFQIQRWLSYERKLEAIKKEVM